jgi:signal transduction histidine kinase
MTNAMKHAKPDKLEVALTYDTDCVRLSIADNGRGFDTDRVASSDEGHFGLLGMRERIERLKGELSLQSHPDRGTAIMVVIPLR